MPTFSTGIFGRYYADGGLLFAVGSVSGGDVDMVQTSRLVSHSSSPSPTASPQPSCQQVNCSGNVSSATPDKDPSAIPRAVQNIAATFGDSDGSQCILLMALRVRPVGFDKSWMPASAPPREPRGIRRATDSTLQGMLKSSAVTAMSRPLAVDEAVDAARRTNMVTRIVSAANERGSFRLLSFVFTSVTTWMKQLRRMFTLSSNPVVSEGARKYESTVDTGLNPHIPSTGTSATTAARVFSSDMAEYLSSMRLSAPDELLVRQVPASLEHRSKHEPKTAHVQAPLVGKEAEGLDTSDSVVENIAGRHLLAAVAPSTWLGADDLLSQEATITTPVMNAIDEKEDEEAFSRRDRRAETADLMGMYPGLTYVPMFGHAVSINCNFSVDISVVVASLDMNKAEEKMLLYSLFVLAISLVLLFSTFHELVASMSEVFAYRVSIITAGMMTLSDGAMFVAHVFMAITQSQAVMMGLFSSSLLYLVLFSFLGMRLMLLIEKARHPERFAGGVAAFMARMWSLQRRFAFAMIVVILIATISGLGWGMHVLVILSCSFWVPQIVHSVRHDCRPGVTPMFLWGSTFARMALPLYALGCPNNILWFLSPSEPPGEAMAWADAASKGLSGDPFNFHRDASQAWLNMGPKTLPAFTSLQRELFFYAEAGLVVFLVCWMTFQVTIVSLQVSLDNPTLHVDITHHACPQTFPFYHFLY